MSKKLTPWFPVETKPARKGVYLVDAVWTSYCDWFAYWDGSGFRWHSKSAEGAVVMRNEDGAGPCTRQWRGLAKKPATKDAEVSNG